MVHQWFDKCKGTLDSFSCHLHFLSGFGPLLGEVANNNESEIFLFFFDLCTAILILFYVVQLAVFIHLLM